VQVALSNAASTTGALTLQNASGSQNAGFQSMTANSTFAYFAGYVAAAQATAGGVSTTVQYALNYQ
jgi:type 1 fimbria pilin